MVFFAFFETVKLPLRNTLFSAYSKEIYFYRQYDSFFNEVDFGMVTKRCEHHITKKNENVGHFYS